MDYEVVCDVENAGDSEDTRAGCDALEVPVDFTVERGVTLIYCDMDAVAGEIGVAGESEHDVAGDFAIREWAGLHNTLL
jgi:hypothetical protein